MTQWIEKILKGSKDRKKPEVPNTLLLAYMGVAAKNIGGTTLHTGLSFKFGSDMLDLSPEKQNLIQHESMLRM